MRPLETRTTVRVVLFLLAPFVLVAVYYGYRAAARAPPSHAMCVAHADHRIALHNDAEPPSIAKWVASTRPSMIDTCEKYWSKRYVACLIDAPSLSAVAECEGVGRVR